MRKIITLIESVIMAIVAFILLASGVIYLIAFGAWVFKKIEKKKIAKKREEEYWSINEPQYRNYKSYPPDWQIRRAFVFYRENGICEKCKIETGYINVSKEKFWLNSDVRIRGFHVHHKNHLSSGGNHAFDNLQLLCEECHDREHPNNSMKKSLQRARSINSLRFSHDSKIKTARNLWMCEICNEDILPKNKYFGDSYTRICMKCYEKYNKSISNKIGY